MEDFTTESHTESPAPILQQANPTPALAKLPLEGPVPQKSNNGSPALLSSLELFTATIGHPQLHVKVIAFVLSFLSRDL